MKKSFGIKNAKYLVALVSFALVSTYSFAQNKTERLDSLFNYLSVETQFSASVLIAEKGKVLYHKAFGYSNYETQTPLDTSSIIELASVSKAFTAMAIMILKEQGKLGFDDKITKYLSNLPYENITIRHLLTHTSGLVAYHRDFLDEYWDKTKIGDNQYLLSLLEMHKPPLVSKPGEKWNYNNTGYCLLALIVEKVSAMSCTEFHDKYIFEPLEMKSSSIFTKLNKTTPKKYAQGHIYSMPLNKYIPADGTGDNRSFYRGGMVGERGVASTTGDLLKWDRALYTEKLVKKQTIDEAFTPIKLNNDTTFNYGFGWFIDEFPKTGRIVRHTGGWTGYKTRITRYIDADKTIILLSNNESPYLPTMLYSIYNILYDMPMEYLQLSIAEELRKIIIAKDLDFVRTEFEAMSNNQEKYYLDEDELIGLGYNLLGLKETAKSIAVFKLNVASYPKSWNAYDSLGEAYMKSGDKPLAIMNYEKSLELNQENQHAVEMLEKIKRGKN